jgi:NADPH:quinone reductase-like Zn-dependent oxidoreductase
MKAVLIKKYSDYQNIVVEEIETPIIKTDEILIRNQYSTINSGDARIRRADPWAVQLAFGFGKPRQAILGMTFSGAIEEVGENVTNFKKGDEVFGYTDVKMGCHSEYVKVKSNGAIFLQPDFLTGAEAASSFFGMNVALHFLKNIKITAQTKVLILGASGAVGTAFIQYLKAKNCQDISTFTSEQNLDLMKSLGVKNTYDYNKQEVTKLQKKYDVIVECVNKYSTADLKKLLTKNGKVVLVATLGLDLIRSVMDKTLLAGVVDVSYKAISELVMFIIEHKIRPVIGDTYKMSDIVKAYQKVDSGHKVGSLVLEIG